jgi:hypothetical protein
MALVAALVNSTKPTFVLVLLVDFSFGNSRLVASWTDVSAFLGNDFGLDFGYRRLGFATVVAFLLV